MSKVSVPATPVASCAGELPEGMIVRFYAPNGATVTVNVGQQPGPDPKARALLIAREAIAQVAEVDPMAAPKDPASRVRKVDCGEHFWAWAMPEGWPR
jgi:hypothetical protein